MDVVRQQVTAEELLLMPDDGFRYELVLGNYAGGDIVPDFRLAVWEVLS